ncbi:MAG: ABC transporter ATP-binding protein [Pseudomonadota bacterium]
MTGLGHLYSDFGSLKPKAPAPDRSPQKPSEDQVADVRLASFEEGYQAGWDDATKSTQDDQGRLSDQLVQRFEDLSFTYQEAHAKLTAAMKPLLAKFVTKLLPEAMHHAVQAQLVDQISALVDAEAEQAIEVAVAPENKPVIENLLADRLKTPFAVSAEPALSDGQIYIRVDQTEREINLDAVLAGISEAVDAFIYELEKEAQDG